MSSPPRPTRPVRVAAAGDIHCHESRRGEIEAAIGKLRGAVDLVLVAGDVTSHGDPAEAAILADAVRAIEGTPVVAVLGNHDHHAGRGDEVAAAMRGAGIEVLDRGVAVYEVAGQSVGIVGTKGFVGGFGLSQLPDFGEPLLRRVYAETTAEVEALDRGLREVADCALRIVLLHYAPIADTLEGERPEIWAFLGTERLAVPIIEHRPNLVVHGHAHVGRFEGSLHGVPVRNVAVPVIGSSFWTFELIPPRTRVR